jgi:hypothetical protein
LLLSHQALHPYLVKPIASFNYAQDGEPVEPYLENKDEGQTPITLRSPRGAAEGLAESVKRAIRDTSNEERGGVSAAGWLVGADEAGEKT